MSPRGKILTFEYDPWSHLDINTFIEFFDQVVTKLMQMPVEYDRDDYPTEEMPVTRFVEP